MKSFYNTNLNLVKIYTVELGNVAERKRMTIDEVDFVKKSSENKCHSAVNFINIMRTNFSYECRFVSFSLVTCT